MADSLAKRLDVVESRREIADLVHAYARFIRYDQPDMVGTLFTEDGTFEIREGHPDRPDWLSHVDPGTIKVKLAASLIGISSIHLLKAFVDVANEDPEHIKWKIFIHMTFLGSAILLAWTDKIMQKDKKH